MNCRRLQTAIGEQAAIEGDKFRACRTLWERLVIRRSELRVGILEISMIDQSAQARLLGMVEVNRLECEVVDLPRRLHKVDEELSP